MRRRSERDKLRQYLLDHEIGCAIYYPLCLHQQECLPAAVRGAHLPVAEEAAATSLTLPIFPELQAEQLAFVMTALSLSTALAWKIEITKPINVSKI